MKTGNEEWRSIYFRELNEEEKKHTESIKYPSNTIVYNESISSQS